MQPDSLLNSQGSAVHPKGPDPSMLASGQCGRQKHTFCEPSLAACGCAEHCRAAAAHHHALGMAEHGRAAEQKPSVSSISTMNALNLCQYRWRTTLLMGCSDANSV